MNFKPLGPDGAQERLRAIQARLDSLRPRRELPSLDPTSTAPEGGLSGAIGKETAEGYRPLNPCGPGMQRIPDHEAPENLKGMIRAAALDAGVEPVLFESLVSAESNFNPNAKSGAGAMGLAQLMPGTARALGVSDPFDPEQNLRAGAKYLAQMLSKFGGNPELALAAYNAGPGAVERHGGIPPFRETKNYVAKVMARYQLVKKDER